jgi:hypothetical protein
MRRSFVFVSILSASAAAVLASARGIQPAVGLQVSRAEAANIRGGGNCGSYKQIANGACTDAVGNTCALGSSSCNGQCQYACSASTNYIGSGTFTGSQFSYECDSVTQPTCTETICSVAGAPVTCCQCLNGSSIDCGPSGSGVDPAGCSTQ